ncbi:MAG: restriction endonuclease [Phascolarctobacterium sp.]|nr:restriction endonuclease [Phascolarctobacterium sp.]
MDEEFSEYFTSNDYYQKDPLAFFFQVYYSKYGSARKYLIFLKKYLLEKNFLDYDMPYNSFVDAFKLFIDNKQEISKVYYSLLKDILVQFINTNETWPSIPTLSVLDIKAIRKLADKRLSEQSLELKTIIENGDLDVTLTFSEFKDEIQLILEELCQEKFNNSFLDIYPEKLRNSYGQITKKGCLSLYVSIFQENNSYITYLINFLDNFAMDFKLDSIETINEIAFELNEIREEITIASHMENLEQGLSDNTGMFNRHYTIEDIDVLDGIDFESFLQKLFTKMGYYAEVTQSTGDQGADLILSKLGRKIAVQAKRYNTKLDNTPIQEVLGAKAYYGCNETMVVTNSYFTKKAIELAHVNQVQLIDRDDLIELLESHPIYKDH